MKFTVRKYLKAIAVTFILALVICCTFAKNVRVLANEATSKPWDGTVATEFAGGDGTESNPYLIATAEQLALMAEKVNSGNSNYTAAYYKLTTNIVLNETIDSSAKVWTPIYRLKGVFDGDEHTISGVYVNDASLHQGLFSQLYYGTIKNVGVINCDITGEKQVGAICGNNYYGTIENCYSTGKVTGTAGTGGICGYTTGPISNCYSECTIAGAEDAGGVCGSIGNDSIMSNCYNKGKVTGTKNVGGVCGSSFNEIKNCYNLGEVRGSEYVGGIVGHNSEGTIDTCYNTGDISSTDGVVGGISGKEYYGVLSNCYNTGKISSDYWHAGGINGDNQGSTIEKCFNKGIVNGDWRVGGISGDNSGIIRNCFNVADITGKGYHIGGLVGMNFNSIENSFVMGNVTGSYAGAVVGVYNGIVTNVYYGVEECNLKPFYGQATSETVYGLTTLELTSGNALEVMGFDTAVWSKKVNDKINKIAYYPELISIENDTTSIGFDTRLSMTVDETSPITYGDNIIFYIAALVKFDGQSEFEAAEEIYGSGAGTFTLQHNGTDITDKWSIWDDSECELEYMLGNLPAGTQTVKLNYDGTGSDFLLSNSEDVTFTIEKAPATEDMFTIPVLTESYIYGTTLGEIELPESWEWQMPDRVPMVGATSWSAAFTPNDNNYDWSNIAGYDSASDKILADIKVTIVPIQISAVAITGVDAPVPEENLDADVVCDTTGIKEIQTIIWSDDAGNATVADYDKIYTVTIKLIPDANYIFTETITATVNGETAHVVLNDDGTISVSYEFEKTETKFVDPIEDFVERMYTVALNRHSDPEGKANWVYILKTGMFDGARIAAEFIRGAEFQLRNLSNEEYVKVLYRTFFDREADDEGKELWVSLLDDGVSRDYVLSKFVNLDEFTILCKEFGIERGVMLPDGTPVTPGIPKFVNRLYNKVLGREADADGLYNWVVALVVKAETAESVVKSVFNSAEYAMKNVSNTQYVSDLYGVFMDREADAEGLNFWVSCIEQHGVTREWVLGEFAKSAEFKILAQSYGLE